MAGAQARTRFGRLAGKSFRRPGIDKLRAAARQCHAHVRERRDGAHIHVGTEGFWRPLRGALFERSPLGFPLWQPAVEDKNLLGPENAKRPPHARRGIKTDSVVNDHGVAIADSQRAHRLTEVRGAGQRMWQLAGMIADRVDIEKYGARNMAFQIFRASAVWLAW